MSAQPLQPHPETQALLDEIALLREELANLLTQEHELLHLMKPNLLAIYQQKIGRWEMRALQAEIAMRRSRRMLELAQAAVNRGKLPDWTEIEGQLELEFLTWQQRLQEAADRLAAAEHRMAHLLPPDEDREFKKLYYALVKALHPDLNPDPDDDRRRLWLRVQDAYQRGDIEELRALAILAEKQGTIPQQPSAPDALRRDRETLEKQIAEMLRRLEHLAAQPPFSLRAQLEDEAWVAARRQEIETRIEQCDSQRAALDAALQILIQSNDDGQKFGLN